MWFSALTKMIVREIVKLSSLTMYVSFKEVSESCWFIWKSSGILEPMRKKSNICGKKFQGVCLRKKYRVLRSCIILFCWPLEHRRREYELENRNVTAVVKKRFAKKM